MKTILTIIALTISLISFAGFEGVITTSVYNQGTSMEVKWFIKDDLLKLQMNYNADNGPVTVEFIVKQGGGKMTIVTNSESYKGYSIINESAIARSMAIGDLVFKKDGIKKDDLTKYQAANAKYQCAIWLTDLDVQLAEFSNFFKDDPAFLLIHKENLSGFPQKSMLTNHNGDLIYAATVAGVEQKSLSDLDFSIPDGFQKRELVEMEIEK